MSTRPPSCAEVLGDPVFPALKAHVISATGLAYYDDKDNDFAERLIRRMTGTDAWDCAAYLAALRDVGAGEAELDQLVEQLTIGETSFFRHAELFDGLRDKVLPDLIRRNQCTRRLRIWSAGCSIGAEAYSVAILLAREFANDIAGWDISIVGTDINRQFLSRARSATFHEWDFRGAPSDVIDDCFIRTGNEWQIRSRYRAWTTFQYHNLVRHPFPSHVHNLFACDLILCRNVIIYFSAPTMQRLVHSFHDSLVDHGWLLVGHSEPNVKTFRAFGTVNVPGAVLYRKTPPTERPPYPEPPILSDRPLFAAPSSSAVARRSSVPSITVDADRGLDTIRRFADAGLLDEAEARCRKLIDVQPDQPVLHFYLAMLLEQVNRHEQAESALRRAIRLDCRFALAHYLLSQVQLRKGCGVDAAGSCETVLALLADADPAATIPHGDCMTVADLQELTRMNLETLCRH